MGRGVGPGGYRVPEKALPGLVGLGGGGQGRREGAPRALIFCPAGRPVGALPRITVELPGEQFGEGETRAGSERLRRVVAELGGDAFDVGEQFPAEMVGAPEGVSPGKRVVGGGGGKMAFKVVGRGEELEAHAQAEIAGETGLQPVGELLRRHEHGDGAGNAGGRRQGGLTCGGEGRSQGGEQIFTAGG